MSDSNIVCVDSHERVPHERELFVYPVTPKGIEDYFAQFSVAFLKNCKDHQVVVNEICRVLAYKDIGILPTHILNLTKECIFDSTMPAETEAHAFLPFEENLVQKILKFWESKAIVLAWNYDGSRESFVEWARSNYTGLYRELPDYNNLRNIFCGYNIEATERYFHYRAKKFYTQIYAPTTEAINLVSEAVHEREIQAMMEGW